MSKPEVHLFLMSKLSQWAHYSMTIDGVVYNCAEQFMMAEKARTFNDSETLEKIMLLDPAHPDLPQEMRNLPWPEFPRKQKNLGREVNGFDKAVWELKAQEVVYRGNYAKFSQNAEAWEVLDKTGTKHLAEANPRDPLWGIGLDFEHQDARNPEKWPGKNWLGEVLMKVRAKIREESNANDATQGNVVKDV